MHYVVLSRTEEAHMIPIYVHKRPFDDDTADPDDIRDAYIGLRLIAEEVFEPGHKPYPDGAYMVPLEEMLGAMESHNRLACEYLRDKYQMVVEVVDDLGAYILLPFSLNSCEVIN